MSIAAPIKPDFAQVIEDALATMSIEGVENAREQICECLTNCTDGPGGDYFEWADLEELSMADLFNLYAGTYGRRRLHTEIVVEYNHQYPAL